MEKKTEKVSQFYVALAQGDFETVGALLSDDLVWHQPGKGALSGIYNGNSMEMKGVDLFRFETGLTKEVWLFSERIDEEDRFWTALAQG